GNAHLRFGDSPERGPITGRAHALLEGYVPPVPIEIKKLAFGKTTEIETSFETSDDRELVSFSGTRVKHGILGLDGGGTIERRDGRAVLHASLEGRLSCRDVAASAAAAHTQGPLTEWLSDLGRATLSGSVGIRVVIDADFADLRAARIVPTVGVGCGLRLP
ncbi:MAG TPA: hypothetical protein VFB62_17885, partial [Polyangiaceae bacterium]|nr:hypothetical protein [Polyangiaceae bacterium]